MEKVDIDGLLSRLEELQNIEVLDYDDDGIYIDKVKGIVKGKVDGEELGDLKKRKPRARPTRKQVGLVREVADTLARNKVKFKVIFGPKEVTIRMGDAFIRIYEKDVRVAGFTDSNVPPLSLIIDKLGSYGPVRFLRPLS